MVLTPHKKTTTISYCLLYCKALELHNHDRNSCSPLSSQGMKQTQESSIHQINRDYHKSNFTACNQMWIDSLNNQQQQTSNNELKAPNHIQQLACLKYILPLAQGHCTKAASFNCPKSSLLFQSNSGIWVPYCSCLKRTSKNAYGGLCTRAGDNNSAIASLISSGKCNHRNHPSNRMAKL